MNHINTHQPIDAQPDQIVLLGDSIFDNALYVNPGESVTEQLQGIILEQAILGNSDMASVSLLAVDGHVMANVAGQLSQATEKSGLDRHMAFVSCGGNDLLSYQALGLLDEQVSSVSTGLDYLSRARERFRCGYQAMLDNIQHHYANLSLCTIYDHVPGLSAAQKTAIAIFNEVILREAAQRQLKVIDLRILCNEEDDYSRISPIEPSRQGAAKIAQAIFNQYQMQTITKENDL